MKLRSLALACVFALGATSAMAADLPARMVTKAPAYVPAFSWTGFYLGGNVGYGFGRTKGTLAGVGGNFDVDGIVGGGQIGANYQVGQWVFGVEADYQGADVTGNNALLRSHLDSYGTVRGRLGYAWDRWMVYGTGGYAFDGNLKETALATGTSISRSLDGWAAGAGVEYAFMPNWSAKLEYLHVDLDDRNYAFAGCGVGTCRGGDRVDTVRVGVNYRFWGGAAPARW